MADSYVYADGTLSTGDNDGGGDGTPSDPTDSDNWTNAYQDWAGLQTAVDLALSSGDDLTIFIRNDFTVTAQLDIDTNAGAGNGFKRIIGCSGLDGPLALGSYVNMDATGTDMGAAIIDISIVNVEIYNVWTKNNDSNGGTPGAGEDGISTHSYGNHLINCKATNCYIGFEVAGSSNFAIDCVGMNCLSDAIRLQGYGTMIIGGWYEDNAMGSAHDCCWMQSASSVIGACFVNGIYGVDNASAYGSLVYGCSFYNQTSAGVIHSGANNSTAVINCIFYLADPAADDGIDYTFGRHIEMYNVYNCDTNDLAGIINEIDLYCSSLVNQNMTNTDPFVNASGDDLELNVGQTIADLCYQSGHTAWSAPSV